VLKASFEVLDVDCDRQELENINALSLWISIPWAILSDEPLSLPENADDVSSAHDSFERNAMPLRLVLKVRRDCGRSGVQGG